MIRKHLWVPSIGENLKVNRFQTARALETKISFTGGRVRVRYLDGPREGTEEWVDLAKCAELKN